MSDQHDPSQAPSSPDQQTKQAAEQAHAEIARLHEQARAEVESPHAGEGKHSLPEDESPSSEEAEGPSSS